MMCRGHIQTLQRLMPTVELLTTTLHRTVHVSHLISSDLIATDLSSSEPSCVRCDATRFAVAATNQARRRDLLRSDCHSHGKLGRSLSLVQM